MRCSSKIKETNQETPQSPGRNNKEMRFLVDSYWREEIQVELVNQPKMTLGNIQLKLL